jgi:hypothetical protein
MIKQISKAYGSARWRLPAADLEIVNQHYEYLMKIRTAT